MTMTKNIEHAVSPVVGVMLMLVVTIIIAAVVSAFAGGLSSGTSKAPQMTMTATFSQSNGMTIANNGGDTINTLTTHFIVSPTTDFGTYVNMRWTVNSSAISILKSGSFLPWYNPTLTASHLARTFQPGETAIINATDLSQVQPGTYRFHPDGTPYLEPVGGRASDAFSTSYGFMSSGAVGQRFNLQLVDNSGKTIATTVVTIQP
jgi:hypothetical protein